MIDSLEERLQVILQAGKLRTEAIAAAAQLEQAVTVIPASGPRATFTPREDSAAEVLSPDNSRLPPSESTNAWPDEAAEAAFLGESRAAKETPPPVAVPPVRVAESSGPKLPKLDDLVQRIPEDARELLEELFRAKFVAVRRVPGKALKVTEAIL